jgi:hypothetical protein
VGVGVSALVAGVGYGAGAAILVFLVVLFGGWLLWFVFTVAGEIFK